MKRVCAILAALVLVSAAGCSRTPVSPYTSYRPPTFGPQDSTFTDDQLRAAVYTNFRWPGGFYHEDEYPAPYYVNALSVKPLCCRPLSDWRELATDDTAQARAWAESTVAYSSNIYPLAPGLPDVTKRYIEFRPAPAAGNPGVAMRAHRMSYLNPLFFRPYFLYADSLVGTFNERPVDTATVRGLAEYLWFKWNRDVVGSKVLSSFGSDQGTVVVHTIFNVETTFGDWNTCDDIRLYRLDFRVAKATGEIVLRRTLQRRVTGACH